jgi:hypothetical protein
MADRQSEQGNSAMNQICPEEISDRGNGRSWESGYSVQRRLGLVNSIRLRAQREPSLSNLGPIRAD